MGCLLNQSKLSLIHQISQTIQYKVWFSLVWFGLVWSYDISTILGYLKKNQVLSALVSGINVNKRKLQHNAL